MLHTVNLNESDKESNVEAIAFRLVQIVDTLIYVFRTFLGVVGLLLISTILLMLVPLTLWALKTLNKSLDKQLQLIYNWINEADPQALRDKHLGIEQTLNDFKEISLIRKRDANILTMGISGQILKIHKKLVLLERTLKRAAYPDIHNLQLSEEDASFLESTFKSAEEDWMDPELDDYERYL